MSPDTVFEKIKKFQPNKNNKGTVFFLYFDWSKFNRFLRYKLNSSITRDSYHLQIFQMSLTFCELRNLVAEIMLISYLY